MRMSSKFIRTIDMQTTAARATFCFWEERCEPRSKIKREVLLHLQRLYEQIM
jgi:hypothetical protein